MLADPIKHCLQNNNWSSRKGTFKILKLTRPGDRVFLYIFEFFVILLVILRDTCKTCFLNTEFLKVSNM